MLLVPMESQRSGIGGAFCGGRFQQIAGEVASRPFPADADDRVCSTRNRDQNRDRGGFQMNGAPAAHCRDARNGWMRNCASGLRKLNVLALARYGCAPWKGGAFQWV